MRLKCAIVSRILAQRTAGDTLPAWVSRHVSRCDSCASEAAAYALMQTAIREAAGPIEPPSLTWQELRATLPVTPRRARRVPILAMAGATAAVLAGVVFGVSLLPQNVKREQVIGPPQTAIRHTGDQPEQVAVKNDDSPIAGTIEKDTPAAAPHRRLLPPRSYFVHYKPHRAPRPMPAPRLDNESTVVADNAQPEPPRYRVVGAEEHVIDVVGATPVSAPDTPDTDYVIRHTDTGDERPAVLL